MPYDECGDVCVGNLLCMQSPLHLQYSVCVCACVFVHVCLFACACVCVCLHSWRLSSGWEEEGEVFETINKVSQRLFCGKQEHYRYVGLKPLADIFKWIIVWMFLISNPHHPLRVSYFCLLRERGTERVSNGNLSEPRKHSCLTTALYSVNKM